MNKFIGYTFLISCLLSAVSLTAQPRHFIDVWGGGGYDALLHGIDHTKVPGGGGFNVGGGYELNVNNFMLQTGVEFQYFGSKTKLIDYTADYQYGYYAQRPDGGEDITTLTYHYNYPEYFERHRAGYLNIPLMFGLRFLDRYYAMLGVKAGVSLFGSYEGEGTVKPTPADPTAIEGFESMYPARDMALSSGLDLGLNMAASAEFGVVLDEWLPAGMKRLNNRRRTPVSYRASVFVDYGLLNINKAMTDHAFIQPSSNEPLTWEQTYLAGSQLAKNKPFHNLYAGVKLAVQFDMTRQRRKPASKPSVEPIPFYARVTDAETDEPMSGVDVVARAGNRQLFSKSTDSDGVVSHEMRKGRYTLSVTEDGYLNYRKTVSHYKTDTVEIPLQRVPSFAVHVYDLETRANLAADVTLTRAADNQTVYQGKTDVSTGMMSYDLRAGRYLVNVAAEGYIYQQSEAIDFTRSDTLEFALQPIKKDVKVVLHNLFFELNKADIKPESGPALEDLYQFLTKNPDVKIHIVGHTDNTGSLAYNMELSEARAKAVYDAIAAKGIAPDRLTYEGKGPNEPVATNDTEEGRAENRRVEFVIK